MSLLVFGEVSDSKLGSHPGCMQGVDVGGGGQEEWSGEYRMGVLEILAVGT